ncbi:DNA-processing protein DprA [Mucisphaera sp.]|uniref:DNA-processing protein DprA n=1 Tax=Mucisphaera sp. TaxID=2913024 RepID=UPI003D14A380
MLNPTPPPTTDDHETRALLALQLTRGLGVRRIAKLLEQHGSAAAALDAAPQTLAQINGISPTGAQKIRRALDKVLADNLPDQERNRCHDANVRLIRHNTDDYPALLGDIPDAPPLLWVQGHLDPADRLALAIVGSRQATAYGRAQAQRFASRCATLGLTIVSGGALGIDGVAHRAALQTNGRTLAVIGSGLANPYPDAHHQLFQQIIAAGNSAMISELPLLTPPAAENFPRRNRIISGLSLATLVVEAGERSGALITARLCVEEHGRDLMAIPGPIDRPESAGCHRAIRQQWATLVTQPEDVLEQLAETKHSILKPQTNPTPTSQANPKNTATKPQHARHPLLNIPTNHHTNPEHILASRTPNTTSNPATPQPPIQLDPLATLEGEPRRIAQALQQPKTLDQLAEHLDLPIGQLQAALTRLEIKGLIQRNQGQLSLRI